MLRRVSEALKEESPAGVPGAQLKSMSMMYCSFGGISVVNLPCIKVSQSIMEDLAKIYFYYWLFLIFYHNTPSKIEVLMFYFHQSTRLEEGERICGVRYNFSKLGAHEIKLLV